MFEKFVVIFDGVFQNTNPLSCSYKQKWLVKEQQFIFLPKVKRAITIKSNIEKKP